VLVTADHDLFQCLLAGEIVMDNLTGKSWDEGRFRAEYGIAPAQWALVKAIGGCDSDGVPGCAPGIGEGRALAYLKNELKPDSRWFKLIHTEDMTEVRRNLEIVRLPHSDFPRAMIPRPEPLRFSKREFVAMCEEYGLASFLKPDKMARWRRVFRGEWET
jgi:5'-3' exonuclease